MTKKLGGSTSGQLEIQLDNKTTVLLKVREGIFTKDTDITLSYYDILKESDLSLDDLSEEDKQEYEEELSRIIAVFLVEIDTTTVNYTNSIFESGSLLLEISPGIEVNETMLSYFRIEEKSSGKAYWSRNVSRFESAECNVPECLGIDLMEHFADYNKLNQNSDKKYKDTFKIQNSKIKVGQKRK